MNNQENFRTKELELLLEQEKKTRKAMLNMLEDIQESQSYTKRAAGEWTEAFDAVEGGGNAP